MSRDSRTHRTGAVGTIDAPPAAAEVVERLRVLIVDDSEDDALVTIRELKRGGYSPTFKRVDTAEAMMSALGSSHWDVIICDYVMPSFSGLASLGVFKASGLDIPFILVSGKVGEERAVEAMRAGATDYVMKDKLNRLVPAIRREVAEAKSRIEYRKAALSLKQSEERYQALAENYAEVVWVTDMNGQVTYVSPSVTRLLGYKVEELMVHDIDLTPASLKASLKAAAQALSAEQGPKADRIFDPAPVEEGLIVHDIELSPASVTASVKAAAPAPGAEQGPKADRIFDPAPVEEGLIVHDIELSPASVTASVKAAAPAPGAGQGAKADSVLDMPPLELELRRKDGSSAWASVSFSLIPDSDGRPAETVAILHDITERKRAEKTLRESEQRLKVLFESAPDAYYMNDMEAKLVDGNRAAEELTGYKREELIGRSFLELGLITAEQIPKAAALLDRNLHGQPTGPDEFVLKRKDGSLVNVEINTFPATINGQSLVLGIVRDITERKQAQEELAQREKKYRQLLETLNEGIWAIDKDSNTTFVNPRMAEMLGYTTDEMVGRHLFAFMDERGVEIAKYNLERRQQGIKEQHDFEFLRKDGTRIYACLETSPIIDDKGEYAGAIAGVQDITERRKVEESLRVSESRYRLLAENLSDVIWTMDTNFRYSYLSPSITRLQGYTVEEAMAQPLEENLTPASLEHAMRIMAEEDARDHTGQYDPNRIVTMEVELHRKDGSTVWVENVASYLRDSNGRITGYLGVSRDITERREATKKLERSFQNLEKAMNGSVQAISLTVESRDRYTAGHQKRVAQLGCAIAQKLGFTSDQIQCIRIAGLLHDIGKISVPQEILSKPGKLTDVEFQLIKAHSQTGYDILKSVEFPWPIADIVVQHHERMNGSGYPSGIREGKLLMEARILAVADVVEAMSSHRPYRAPLGVDKALEEISCNSGILYDPGVVNACMWVFNDEGFKFED